jgi:hypothetical protein
MLFQGIKNNLLWLYLKLMPVGGFFMEQQMFLILEKTNE